MSKWTDERSWRVSMYIGYVLCFIILSVAMEKMGCGRQPYFIYYHHDTNNNHVHILSTRINRYGIAISDSFDKMRMQRVSEEILGITPEKEKQKLFSYSFQTEGQFLNVARFCGYNLNELRQKLGIDIHWQKDRNGVVRGYGIVDHKTKMAFDGSQVLRMHEWMDAGMREDAGKGQKVKGSLGHVPPTDEFVDYVSVFKHKNGDHYLRVSFKDYDHSVKFRLSQDEAWAYITARDDGQRAFLKRQFAAKYLLKGKDECRGQNREWEVEHGSYEVDCQRTLVG